MIQVSTFVPPSRPPRASFRAGNSGGRRLRFTWVVRPYREEHGPVFCGRIPAPPMPTRVPSTASRPPVIAQRKRSVAERLALPKLTPRSALGAHHHDSPGEVISCSKAESDDTVF